MYNNGNYFQNSRSSNISTHVVFIALLSELFEK